MEPGFRHVIEKLTRRVNASVVPPRLSRATPIIAPHSHILESQPDAGGGGAWTTQLPHLPTAIPHTHTPTLSYCCKVSPGHQTNKMWEEP